jgi:glyoxylase-like metal-dependent hydrolase (beta-lactamase superfamily II)
VAGPSHRARVGAVEVVSLLDAEGTFTSFRKAFPEVSEAQEALARAQYAEHFRGDAWFLPFRCFLLRLPGSVVLVDAGVAGQRHFLADAQAQLPAALHEEGLAMTDVDVVLLTHLHVDHVGWTVEAGRPVFPRARYLACSDDVEYFLRDRADSRSVAEKVAPLAALPGFEQFPLAEREVASGVTVIPAPGHTPGHVAVRVDSCGSSLVILGDAAVHPLQVSEPELEYVFDADPPAAARTRRELLDEVERSGTLVAAGHFPGSGIGRIATVDGRRTFLPVAP